MGDLPAPHATLWVSLHAAHQRHGGRKATTWTRAEVLTCLASWAAEHGRPPMSSELKTRQQLPGYGTITLACGSVASAYAALGWPYHLQGTASAGRANREQEAGEGDGSWMNGTPVRFTGESVSEWWETDE